MNIIFKIGDTVSFNDNSELLGKIIDIKIKSGNQFLTIDRGYKVSNLFLFSRTGNQRVFLSDKEFNVEESINNYKEYKLKIKEDRIDRRLKRDHLTKTVPGKPLYRKSFNKFLDTKNFVKSCEPY